MHFACDFCTALEILAFTLEEFVKGAKKPRSGSSLILLILFYFASNYPRFRYRTSQMQLNPVYYVHFIDIYPLQRTAALKITEFWPSVKPEKAPSDRKKFCAVLKHRKRFCKKWFDFNHSSFSPFHSKNKGMVYSRSQTRWTALSWTAI